MKQMLGTFIMAISMVVSLGSYAEKAIRGVNYDPIHSVAFAHGLGTDDYKVMKQAVFNDLDKLKELNTNFGIKITHLKTFFTIYSSFNNKITINMADIVYQWNQLNPDNQLTLALGVYEFRPGTDACNSEAVCEQWTQIQIDGVKHALSEYNSNEVLLIDKVIVGNEDLQNNIEPRLVKDINQITNYIEQNNIKKVSVGTAQIVSTVMSMYQGQKYQDVLNAADFIGINVYPFWGGASYDNNGVEAKASFSHTWENLRKTKNWGKKPVIETEEGWPSNGNNRAGLAFEHDYFNWWYLGHTPGSETPNQDRDYIVQTSYLFALNDKLPGQGIESNWGLFSADNSSNIFENINTGGKKFDKSIVFPLFNNFIGVDVSKQVVYDLSSPKKVTITACTEDSGKGTCYPIYGFENSGSVDKVDVDNHSWSGTLNGFTKFTPGSTNQLMIDSSTRYYKSLFVILDDGKSYPGICWVDTQSLKSLKNDSQINVIWPDNGLPQPCNIQF